MELWRFGQINVEDRILLLLNLQAHSVNNRVRLDFVNSH
jgi:hypothetical protein